MGKHGIINARYLQARRRAARWQAPAHDKAPALRPQGESRVTVGCLRDPAAPIEIFPAIHTPASMRVDRYDLVAVLALIGFGLIFFGVI
ncbi:MAG TPA: hypothetical protein VF285_11275 [Castellaniella sp.]|uniref:hypothetical protein n=1 Tax=Castellaniella sp. TaxID=1955812 RepID=UPI002EF663F8